MNFDHRYQVFRQRETVRVGGRGVRLCATGATKTACRAAFERKRAEALTPSAVPARGTKTFEAFAEEWLATYPAAAKNRETTRIGKEYHVRVRLVPYFRRLSAERGGAPITLGEITARTVDRLIADLGEAPKLGAGGRELAAKLSAQTIRNILQTLRKMLLSARRWDEVAGLPEIPSVKVDRAKIDFLTFEEADRLLNAAADDRALLILAVRTGLRAGELLGLQWSDVDLVKGEIRVEAQIAHNGARRVPVKAGARTVPISAATRAALSGPRRGPWVFCDVDGRPFTRSDLRRKLERCLARAGMRRIHPHVLRHTFASHLIMRGVGVPQVQAWLGHTSIGMTMRYAHLAPGAGASQISVLDSASAAEVR